MPDPRFTQHAAFLTSPAEGCFAITPADAGEFAQFTRFIYVGGAGNLVVVMEDGTVGTFVAVPVGTVLPVRAFRVNATGTTATNLVGLY